MSPSLTKLSSMHGPSRGILDHTVGGNHSQEYLASTYGLPFEEAAVQVTEEEPTRREQPPNQFPGWKEVLHPSSLVIAARQIYPISQGSKGRPHSRSSRERMAWCQRAEEELKVLSTKSEPTSPMKEQEIAQWVTPTPCFLGVTACLQKDPLPEKACEVPPDPLWIAAVMEPTMATRGASCIVKDEATGVTYMDTVTTSMGQVALSGPKQGTPAKGPIIEDINNLSYWTSPWLPSGRRVGWWLPLGRKIEMPLGRNHNQKLIIFILVIYHGSY